MNYNQEFICLSLKRTCNNLHDSFCKMTNSNCVFKLNLKKEIMLDEAKEMIESHEELFDVEIDNKIVKIPYISSEKAVYACCVATEKEMVLYHVCNEKQAKVYKQNKRIKKPVRGFTTIPAAMAWAMKTGRKIIYEIKCDNAHKLPDHHNEFGEAWWNDGDVTEFRCEFSAEKDA